MTEPQEETDAGFVSGAWVGYYTYFSRPAQHRMDLHLAFGNARIHGDGIDDVGKFVIQGEYQRDSRECWWIKTYPGSHQIYYRGRQRGKMIAGHWQAEGLMTGGFCIWPKIYGELTGEFFVEEEEEVVEDLKVLVMPGRKDTWPAPCNPPRCPSSPSATAPVISASTSASTGGWWTRGARASTSPWTSRPSPTPWEAPP